MDNNNISNAMNYSDFSENRIFSKFLRTIKECLKKAEVPEADEECLMLITSTMNKFFETTDSKTFSGDIKTIELVKEALNAKNLDVLKMQFGKDSKVFDIDLELNSVRDSLDNFQKKIYWI